MCLEVPLGSTTLVSPRIERKTILQYCKSDATVFFFDENQIEFRKFNFEEIQFPKFNFEEFNSSLSSELNFRRVNKSHSVIRAARHQLRATEELRARTTEEAARMRSERAELGAALAAEAAARGDVERALRALRAEAAGGDAQLMQLAGVRDALAAATSARDGARAEAAVLAKQLADAREATRGAVAATVATGSARLAEARAAQHDALARQQVELGLLRDAARASRAIGRRVVRSAAAYGAAVVRDAPREGGSAKLHERVDRSSLRASTVATIATLRAGELNFEKGNSIPLSNGEFYSPN